MAPEFKLEIMKIMSQLGERQERRTLTVRAVLKAKAFFSACREPPNVLKCVWGRTRNKHKSWTGAKFPHREG